jgi:hypothetical protein
MEKNQASTLEYNEWILIKFVLLQFEFLILSPAISLVPPAFLQMHSFLSQSYGWKNFLAYVLNFGFTQALTGSSYSLLFLVNESRMKLAYDVGDGMLLFGRKLISFK